MAVIYLVNTDTGGGPVPTYQGARHKDEVEWQIKNDPGVKHKIVDFICDFGSGTPFEGGTARFTRHAPRGVVNRNAAEARYPYALTLIFDNKIEFKDPIVFKDPACPEVIIKNNVSLWFQAVPIRGVQPSPPPPAQPGPVTTTQPAPTQKGSPKKKRK